MKNDANKKTPEELPDEAVGAVAGGAPELTGPHTLTPEELAQLLGGQEEEDQQRKR